MQPRTLRRTILFTVALVVIVGIPLVWLEWASCQERVGAQPETAFGMQTYTFDTLHGQVVVNWPADAAVGDSVSGSFETHPAGKTETEQSRHQDELNGFIVEVEGQQTPVSERVFQRTVSGHVGADRHLILRTRSGVEMGRTTHSLHLQATTVYRTRVCAWLVASSRRTFSEATDVSL